jgi:hypothetical protein
MKNKKRVVTEMGNTFNGATQLVQMGADGKLPAVDGSNLTGIEGLTSQQLSAITFSTLNNI